MRLRAIGPLRCHLAAVAIGAATTACGSAVPGGTAADSPEVAPTTATTAGARGRAGQAIYNGPVAFAVLAEGLSVTFTDHSAAKVDGQQWVFGDGATSTAASPVHVYSREGSYDVSETITDAHGQASVRTVRVRVIPSPPPLRDGEGREALSAVAGYDLNFVAMVPEGASKLEFELTGNVGDAELFVRHGSAPTDQEYDCHRLQQAHVVICAFDLPSGGPYYARLLALRTFSSEALVASWRDKKK